MGSAEKCLCCNAKFYGRQNRLDCTDCKLSVHAKCVGVKTDEEFQLMLPSFCCNTCRLKSNSASSAELNSNGSIGNLLPTIVEKLDYLTSEVLGLRQQIVCLTAENTQLKCLVEQLCKSGFKQPVQTNSVAHPTPLYSQTLKQPVYNPTGNMSSNSNKESSQTLSRPSHNTSKAARGNGTSADLDSDGEFIEVKNRKSKRTLKETNAPPTSNLRPAPRSSSRPEPLIGVKISSNLKCASLKERIRYKALFITRLDPSTTAAAVENDLKADLPVLDDLKVSKLATRQNHYASFHIQVPLKDFPLINNTTIWPEGILVKEFYGRLTPDKCFGYTPPSDQNSTEPANTLTGDSNALTSDENSISS